MTHPERRPHSGRLFAYSKLKSGAAAAHGTKSNATPGASCEQGGYECYFTGRRSRAWTGWKTQPSLFIIISYSIRYLSEKEVYHRIQIKTKGGETAYEKSCSDTDGNPDSGSLNGLRGHEVFVEGIARSFHERNCTGFIASRFSECDRQTFGDGYREAFGYGNREALGNCDSQTRGNSLGDSLTPRPCRQALS